MAGTYSCLSPLTVHMSSTSEKHCEMLLRRRQYVQATVDYSVSLFLIHELIRDRRDRWTDGKVT